MQTFTQYLLNTKHCARHQSHKSELGKFVPTGLLVQNLMENNYSPSDLKYPGPLGQTYL